MELGRLEEAENSFTHAIMIKPDYAEAMLNQAMLSIRQNQITRSKIFLKKVIEISNDDLNLMAAVKLAVLNFQEGDIDTADLLIENSKKILSINTKLVKHDAIYHIFLNKLIFWHKINDYSSNKHSEKLLHVIGESHALSSNRLFIKNFNSGALCKAHCIYGCKQWHLGNSRSNYYKEQFERLLHSLPEKTSILLAIGEIDCRLDDGIIKHYRKYPAQNLAEIIKSTIKNYLIYVNKKTAIKSINVIIQGIPCPNIDIRKIEEKDVSILINLVREFNFILKKEAKKFGFDFLDLHTLTDRGDGHSNGVWHIDNYHLSPAGMLEAWKQHYEFLSSDTSNTSTKSSSK
jgi:tetratricopeptide (TPR) repeat protein